MNERQTGEVDEIAYTFGYCDELDPQRLALPLLRAGYAAPVVQAACELGFGYGVSVNTHAAGSGASWHGTDFNAVHAGFAQALAREAGSRAELSGERFAEFCRREDLPDFDFIGMHGVWSWVSDENRALIADFLRRRLKPGGVLYLSYNAQPGWAAMLPVRELMMGHFQASAAASGAHGASSEARTRQAVKAAVGFAREVFAARPGYAVVNPGLAERVEALAREDTQYLAHEYFNRDWQALSFRQVAASLAGAGLVYAGSADYRDHFDEINLDAAQRALLAGIADPVQRETVRDVCMNRSLRRDYWIKAPRRLDAAERDAALRMQRVVLALPRAAVALKVRGALGEAGLPEALYGPILDALADHRPATLGELEQRVRERGVTLAQLTGAVMLLVGTGALLNAQDEARRDAARPAARRLNAAICEQALDRDAVQFLASPVSGSGIRVPRVAQLFLLARRRGMVAPREWGEFAAGAMAAGEPVEQAVLAERIAQAERFARVHLPVLLALGIG
ncbi:class I SAM-dependent methyltransferase [Burkholderia plantarii]|uniref:class I SAM-dependent methyltransferase n=1 Tax=Burkholderia plantarii TaxID=41899 RepID=UPI0018DCD187|nr:class I SAM-dependent methyltransferase [Burkholderia plantarii]MBI0325781.1 class I SAM-dependent methyltransferase [Burkholderia plantarii]